ncbi:LOW QUALITY PROTEIN: hypothetical protein ACHAWF_001243 [Thalassiosira exigua]
MWAQVDFNQDPALYPQIDYLDLFLETYPNATYFSSFRSIEKWFQRVTHWDKRPLKESPTSLANWLMHASITGFPSGKRNNSAEFSEWFCWHVSRMRCAAAKLLVELDIEDEHTARRMASIFGIKEHCWNTHQ